MDAITLLTAALATARLTRLVTTDRITQAPRQWALRKLSSEGLLAYLIVCDWCASVYAAAAVVAITVWGGTPGTWVLTSLALSYAAGWLAAREDGE
jgi:hypothetical protein